MEAVASLIIHDIVANYSAYHIPVWQPIRIKHAVGLISDDIAEKLDYTSPNTCIKSLSDILNVDVTPYIVEHKFPVWIDLISPETNTPVNSNAVITYAEHLTGDREEAIKRIEAYAKDISADFILLTGRTQGYLQLEKRRVKDFAQIYERVLFISSDMYIREDLDNLFDIVPYGKIGITNDINLTTNTIDQKLFLIRSDIFSKTKTIDSLAADASNYEASLMSNTRYDDNVILCGKEHANIWNEFTCPIRFNKNENRAWIEISIYRNNYEVFELPEVFNQTILKDTDFSECKVIRYENFAKNNNIVNWWHCDNNIVGYKNQEGYDTKDFKILCLGHKQEQFDSIQDRSYLHKVNLNELNVKFTENNSESKIYEIDFDYLFPGEEKYVGLVSASWNNKYIGLNPIDRFHQWGAIKHMDERSLICADACCVSKFISGYRPVLKDIYPSITIEHIKEFLQLVKMEPLTKQSALSNQIIASRATVKSLFEFYQENDILQKIMFFLKKYDLQVRKEYMIGRGAGYFSETVTLLWIAQQDCVILPQEIIKTNWYF